MKSTCFYLSFALLHSGNLICVARVDYVLVRTDYVGHGKIGIFCKMYHIYLNVSLPSFLQFKHLKA